MEENKVTLYLHPAFKAGMFPVSRKVKVGRRVRMMLVCWFDAPGAWNDNTWNVHIDGCDYECASLEECKEIPPRINGYENVEYVTTEEAWKW